MHERIRTEPADSDLRFPLRSQGLGKSIQTIAFIHTLLTHPAIQISDIKCSDSAKINNVSPKKRLIRTVLLLAPGKLLINVHVTYPLITLSL